MSEFNYVERQTVPYRQAALLNNTSCGCRRSNIVHQDGFGGITIRGAARNQNAKYELKYSGNIAVSEGATVGPISVAVTINGEIVTDTIATVTPAAVGDFWHVSGFKVLDIPLGCCTQIAIENVSAADTAGVNPSIDIQNLLVSLNQVIR